MVSTMTNSETVTIPAGYKQTEVGVVPEDWIIEPLINLCAVIDGDRGSNYPSSNDFFPDGYCVFLSATNVTKKGFKFNEVSFISKEKDDLLRKGKLKRGDVVLTTRGSVGHFSYYDESVSFENLRINSGMVLIRNETEKFSNDYLSTLLNSPIIKNQIETMSFDSAQPQLTVRDINSFYLCFPIDKSEQTAIANALSDVDKLIAALETLIAKKSAIKTAAMQQLLTGKKRLPAFAGERKDQHLKANEQSIAKPNEQHRAQPNSASDTPSQHHSDAENNHHQHTPRPGYKHTELGEIPEDWEAGLFGDYLEHCTSGATPYRGTPNFYKGDVRWITSGELNYNVITDTTEKISKDAVKKTSLRMHPAGTFLMAITGLEAAGTRGSCGIVGAPSTTNQSCMALYTNNKLSTDYLFHYYVYMGEELAFKYCQGSKQQSYTAKIVKLLPIATPVSVEEQTAIANVLSDMDTELDALQQRLAKTQTIKQGMMQELLTGKTRLV